MAEWLECWALAQRVTGSSPVANFSFRSRNWFVIAKQKQYSMINLNRNERNPYISGCIWVRESFMVSFHSNWNSILVYLLQIFWNHQSMSQTIPFIQRVKLWNEQKNYNLALPIFLMSSLFICHFKTNKAKNSRRVSS